MSLDAEGALPPARPKRDVEIGIFLVGLVCLMVELLHTRMLAFFLGSTLVSILGWSMLGLFPARMLVTWAVVGLVEVVLAALLGGYIYKEKPAAA